MIFKITILFTFLFTAMQLAYGNVLAPQSIQDLKDADVIVVASASGNFPVGSVPKFFLSVTRVVKGSPSLAGTVMSIQWTKGSPFEYTFLNRNVLMNVSGQGIWFLRSSNSHWELVPVTQGNIPFEMAFYSASASSPIQPTYSYEQTASISDKLASELSSAIESVSGTYNIAFYNLLTGDLDILSANVSQALYASLSASQSVRKQILGLSGQVRNGNAAALARAVASTSSFREYTTEYGILVSTIRDKCRPLDAPAISTLGKAALDSMNQDLGFRTASAHALASIHTRLTLPYLAQLMTDAAIALRVEGIGGISAFANGLSVQREANVTSMAYLQLPSKAPFQTDETIAHFAMGTEAIEADEQRYLSFWIDWWSKNRNDLGF